MFDFANSSFTTVIITVVFSVYFTNRIAKDSGLHWNLVLVISNAIIIMTAPVVGTIADRSTRKKSFLFGSYLLCCIATAALFFAGPGDVALAMFLVILANVAFISGENLVAGFLPELAEPDEMGKVSSWGWGIGYAGALLALGLCLPLALIAKEDPSKDVYLRSTNLVVAAFFLIGGLPTFLWVRERRSQSHESTLTLKEAITAGFTQVHATWRRRSELPDLFRFLFAFVFFNIGIYGVIGNAGLYARELVGMTQDEIIVLFIVTQITAGAGAIGGGRATSAFGCVRTVSISLLIWIACGTVAFFTTSVLGFWVVAVLAGLAMGCSLSASRAVVGLFTPQTRSGEIFGFWGVSSRIAALLAGAGNAILLSISDNDLKVGIVYFTASFIVGLILLNRVDENGGVLSAKSG